MDSQEARLKVLFVSSEVAPYSKTGGLGDVCGTLPRHLAKLGAEVRVVTPYYMKVGGECKWSKVAVNGEERLAILRKAVESPSPLRPPQAGYEGRSSGKGEEGGGFEVEFIDNDHYFGRPAIYGEADDAERFVFFDRATLALIKETGWQPDVIHCHDWQTGLIPVLLRTEMAGDPFFAGSATVFTIHNLAYQGLFGPDTMSMAGLDQSLFTFDKLEFYGQFSFLKGGIVFSDIVTTVSPRYAKEIQTPEFGERLDGALRERGKRLFGILNGIDYETWDASGDGYLKRKYDASRAAAGKAANKKALREEVGLSAGKGPLVGMVSRLATQKGWDILAEAMEALLAMGVQFVVLGTGEAKYEEMVKELQEKHVGQVAALLRFDERLAHRIYAGSDLFLMPSRYEPCGLGQMIALRYGSVPVVRATGGLADTIRDVTAEPSKGNGFVFEEYTAEALKEAMGRAVKSFRDKDGWNGLVARAMGGNFSWERSAKEYLELYRAAVEMRRRGVN